METNGNPEVDADTLAEDDRGSVENEDRDLKAGRVPPPPVPFQSSNSPQQLGVVLFEELGFAVIKTPKRASYPTRTF